MKNHQTCQICGHQTQTTCTKCAQRIHKQLTQIHQYTIQAHNELTPSQTGNGATSERTLGIRLDALDLIAGNDVLPILESWEQMFRQEWGYTPWGPTTANRCKTHTNQALAYLTATIAFHQAHIDRILQHPTANDYNSEIHQCWQQARTAARAQPRQAWRVTCPTDTNNGECGNTLSITGQDLDQTITCHKCRTHWPTERLLWVVATSSQADLWIDTEAASKQTGIPESTLRRWAKQGRIKKQGTRYEYKSLITALQTTHTQPAV
jgi:hypothetical protein